MGYIAHASHEAHDMQYALREHLSFEQRFHLEHKIFSDLYKLCLRSFVHPVEQVIQAMMGSQILSRNRVTEAFSITQQTPMATAHVYLMSNVKLNHDNQSQQRLLVETAQHVLAYGIFVACHNNASSIVVLASWHVVG